MTLPFPPPFGPPATSPLAGLARPLGTPSLVETMGQEQADRSRGLHEGAESLAADAAQARASWHGAAAEAFSGHVEGVRAELLRAAWAHRQAADALWAWSDALAAAQAGYDEAEAVGGLAMAQERVFWDERVRRASAPDPPMGAPSPGPMPPIVSPLRAVARDQAMAAIAAADAAAARCAAAFGSLTPEAPEPAPERDSGGWRSWVHGGLDLVGLAPVVGEPADVVNGLFYAAEGDGVNAGMSFGGAIPVAGWGFAAVKGGRKGKQALDEAEEAAAKRIADARAAGAAGHPDDIARLLAAQGDSKALRRKLEDAGFIRPAKHDAHHIVAKRQEGAADARRILAEFGIRIDDARNGVFLPNSVGVAQDAGTAAAVHRGLHKPEYHARVFEALDGVSTREEALEALDELSAWLLRGAP